jgi:hypothetical protein
MSRSLTDDDLRFPHSFREAGGEPETSEPDTLLVQPAEPLDQDLDAKGLELADPAVSATLTAFSPLLVTYATLPSRVRTAHTRLIPSPSAIRS